MKWYVEVSDLLGKTAASDVHLDFHIFLFFVTKIMLGSFVKLEVICVTFMPKCTFLYEINWYLMRDIGKSNWPSGKVLKRVEASWMGFLNWNFELKEWGDGSEEILIAPVWSNLRFIFFCISWSASSWHFRENLLCKHLFSKPIWPVSTFFTGTMTTLRTGLWPKKNRKLSANKSNFLLCNMLKLRKCFLYFLISIMWSKMFWCGLESIAWVFP